VTEDFHAMHLCFTTSRPGSEPVQRPWDTGPSTWVARWRRLVAPAQHRL